MKIAAHLALKLPVQRNLVMTFTIGKKWPSCGFPLQKFNGSDSQGNTGKMLYSSVIIILFASGFRPLAVILESFRKQLHHVHPRWMKFFGLMEPEIAH